MKEKVTITLEKELIGEIDKERGLIKRSSYIEDILKKRKSK